jgi:hypothetical protein
VCVALVSQYGLGLKIDIPIHTHLLQGALGAQVQDEIS